MQSPDMPTVPSHLTEAGMNSKRKLNPRATNLRTHYWSCLSLEVRVDGDL